MINHYADCEIDIDIYKKANEKFQSCKNSVQYLGQRACKIFFIRMEQTSDFLAICGSCKANTDSPSSKNNKVRFS